MSLGSIVAAIAAQAEAQAGRELSDARARAELRMDEARQQAEIRRESARLRVHAGVAQDRLRTLSQAILEARRRTDEARQEWIVEVLNRAADRLRAIRTDPRYPRLLQAWITEATGVLTAGGGVGSLLSGDEGFEIEVDPRDLPAASEALGAQPTRARLVAGRETSGGVILRTADGAVVVLNTIDSRLERAAAEIRRRLARMLLQNLPEWSTGPTETPRQREGSRAPAG